jgi:DNA replication protein DnaC
MTPDHLRRAAWGNATLQFESKEGEYDCPICNNRLFTLGEREGYFKSFICECTIIRKNLAAIRRSGMENLIRKFSFDNFDTDESWQKTLLNSVLSFAKKPEGWLLLCGQSGSGKTHLASAVCRHFAAKHMQLQFMSWVEEAAALKALSTDYEGRTGRMDKFKEAQVLFIDDLFKCGSMQRKDVKITDADLRLIQELLEYRNIHKKITILTTELTPDRLQELDSALFGRIVENCGEHILTIPYDESRNHRTKHAGKTA